MSLRAALLAPYLRLTEKRHLARAETPEALRRSFEIKARLFFPAPPGTVFAEDRLGPVPALRVHARGVAGGAAPLILYFHGGGYVFGSPRTHRGMLARLSKLCRLPACLPEYRLAPEHPFPAAIDDAVAAYRAVQDRPGGIILGGDSAGGGLALALLLEILRQGLPLPQGLFAFSPLTDMSFSGASLAGNVRADPLLPAARAGEMAQMYLQSADPHDPRASPLLGEFTGAPPVWLTVAETEILLDDTRRLAGRLGAQGVKVTCPLAGNLPHVWPIFPPPLLPEAQDTLQALAGWIRGLLPPTGDS